MSDLTSRLAHFAATAADAPIPNEAILAARRAFLDTAGVMLAGWREPVVEIVDGCCRDGDEAFAFAGSRQLSSRDAALLNGVAGHALDYDDVAVHGHPSVVLVPAILAEAQRLGSSGLDALRAYVIGFETWAELGLREPDAFHLRSWHPTVMLGTIAATASLIALNGLTAGRAGNALAIAASCASGIIANFGTMTKPLQVGRAAAHAIDAVQLARAGITGASDALENAHGFLHGISPRDRVDCDTPARPGGKQWRLLDPGLSVKRYPVCYASHRVVDAIIELAREGNVHAGDVASVRVGLGVAQAQTLRYAQPEIGLEAKFSLQHNVAAALVDRQLGFAQLTDDYVRRPDVVRLFPLVSIDILDEECPDQPGMARCDHVVIETLDGRQLESGDIRYARGHARLPLSDEDLAGKFLDCADHGGMIDGKPLLESLLRLDSLGSVRELFPLHL